MHIDNFDRTEWIKRLTACLHDLEAAQQPFLQWYFTPSGYPRILRNGRDETPYPSEALGKLYDDALFEARFRKTEKFKKLKAALDPVRGVLRDHPTLSRAMGRDLKRDEFQVGILNHTSMTTLSQLIVGLMEYQDEGTTEPFSKPASDLSTLLELSLVQADAEKAESLGTAIDVAVYCGACFEDEVELGEEYALLPFEQLADYVDMDWLKAVAAEQVSWRRMEQVFGIVRRFPWKPSVGNLHFPPEPQTRNPPPLFHRWAAEFANLLSVVMSYRVSWLATFEGCIPRRAAKLLGSHHDAAQTHKGRSISHLFSPSDRTEFVGADQITLVKQLFSKRRNTEYPEMAAIIQRLAEAHRRDGRFALEDRVLDLAIVFERLFKPRGRSIGRELEKSTAELLAVTDDEKNSIREQLRQFYKVRSAIIHGPSDERSRRLISQSEKAWQGCEPIARAALLKKIS